MSLAFEIISPERLILARSVDMAVVPGSEGDLGILPDHSPLITTLRRGLIELYEGSVIVDRFLISGGFVEAAGERCSVLADQITKVSEFNQAEINNLLARVQHDAETTDGTGEPVETT